MFKHVYNNVRDMILLCGVGEKYNKKPNTQISQPSQRGSLNTIMHFK